MTTIPISPASHPTPANPPAAAAPRAPTAPPVGQLGAIDPVKLLNKHKWLLVGAAIAGALVGVGTHFLLLKVYPMWQPIVLFHCLPPQESIGLDNNFISEVEMNRFMQTQVKIMTSDSVLSRVVEDPSIKNNAPLWSKRYMKTDRSTGQERFDPIEAADDLKDHVNARVVPQTTLIELAMTDRAKHDATAILALMRQKYMAVLRETSQTLSDDRTRSLRDTLQRIDDEVGRLAVRREGLIQSKGVDSISDHANATRMALTDTNETLGEVQQGLQALRAQLGQMEKERNSRVPQFGDNLRQEIEKDPLIIDIKGDISRYQTMQQGMLNRGITREHRNFKELDAQIAGAEASLEQARSEALQRLFDGELDGVRKSIGQYEAQESNLVTQRQDYSNKLIDLTRTQGLLADIENQIKGQLDTKAKTAAELQTLLGVTALGSANRVVLLQPERVPTELSFPKLKLMIPAGIVITIGLVGGLVFLREMVDQRIKGPSDISIIPRTRLLGWIPEAGEDPAGQGAAETAFRDRPKGIVAESFRQVRSAISKRTQQANHRTILVLAGMPGSGATSTVANLALAFAAADHKVLVIDANFRRPSLHRVFGLPDAPGLADVLSRTNDFATVVQQGVAPNLDMLAAGSKEHRVFERLSTDSMTDLLAHAKANYDLVLIDVAPAIVAGDGVALAHRCDASVLVVRALSEKRGMVARIKNDLTDARSEFLGVIVNGVHSARGGYMKGNIKAQHEYQKS